MKEGCKTGWFCSSVEICAFSWFTRLLHQALKSLKNMANIKMKKLAFGVSAALLVLGAPAIQAATLTIGVAANFKNPLVEIIAAYNSAYPGNTITYTSASTGSLKAAIIAGGSYNGPYDLFLAANTDAPADLAANYASLVEGTAFTYAKGYLTLWSNDAGVNISSGLPSGFYATYGQVAIADPANAPYGAAAWSVLQSSPHYIASLPDYQVAVYSNIDTTYQTVALGTQKIGFVAKSQVCQKTGGTESFTGTSHYVYNTPITQQGIKIERTIRTSADDALLASFKSYLSGATATAIIQKYCYS